MKSTLFIPEYNYARLAEKIAKLNKKAFKLGCFPVTLVKTGNTDTHEIKENGRVVEIIPMVEVTVTGEAPSLSGWQLLGVLEFDQNYRTPVVREVPGQIVPKKYRNATSKCDHCKSDRRRNEVFIVTNGKKTMQVGRSCIADFLGHRSPEHFLHYATFLRNIDELLRDQDDDCYGGGGRENPCWPVEFVLALAHNLIAKNGFTSRKMADEVGGCSTGSQVAGQLYQRDRLPDKERITPTPANYKAAKLVLKWMKKIDAGDSTYLHTLKMVGKEGIVTGATLGVTASAYTAYLKANELLQEKKRTKPSQYIGTIGKRETFEVRFMSATWVDTFYGMLAIVRLQDRAGNTLIWKTHALASQFDHAAASGYVDGKTQVTPWYTIKATVKEHSEFRGLLQTMLQRVTVGNVTEEREKLSAKKAA